MKQTQTVGLAFAVSLFFTAPVAAACTSPKFSAAELQLVNPAQINQNLIASTVIKVINAHRCQARRVPLRESRPMRVASLMHSKNMAHYGRLKHVTRKKGEQTLKQRFLKAGLTNPLYAENIAYSARLNHQGKQMIVVDQKNCVFHTKARQQVRFHTYASLAQWAGTLWMNSPPHRRTLLSKNLTSTAAAAAFRKDAKFPCGVFYMTQNFGR